ncbi:MAG: hypothetical protein HY303_01165 [Candidatus Wallbacteria bacterium]|nr:hypothetical protein [Candidatus Wallbacteria bacterium]
MRIRLSLMLALLALAAPLAAQAIDPDGAFVELRASPAAEDSGEALAPARAPADAEPAPAASGETVPAPGAAPAAVRTRASYLPLRLDGQLLAPVRMHGENIDFQLGRDNLAFVNPSGVMRLGNMAGNCYTMAFVAKLFFEDAEYLPGPSEPSRDGVRMSELASHLAGGRRGKFTVRGYESLFDLTSDRDPSHPKDLESRLHEAIRAANGLAVPPASTPPGHLKSLTEISQFITSVHYFFYVQRTGHSFLRSVLVEKLAGDKGPAAVTREQAESLKAELRAGKTALFCLWNNSIFFGHVVLAYGCVETADADFFICYDNNEQHGAERRPCVIRVGKQNHSIRKFIRSDDGTLSGGTGEACEAVLHLPDLTIKPENLADLERIVRHADQQTAYLMAGRELVESLSERSPETSSLFNDVRQLVLNVQAIQQALALDGIRPEDRIGPDASLEQVNALLARYADVGARAAAPHGLPPGVSVSNVRLAFRDERTANVAATIRVAAGTTGRQALEALRDGAALADASVARWLAAARDTAGEEPIRADVRFDLTKGSGERSVFGALKASGTPFGPVAVLRRAHLVVGDIEPSAETGGMVVVEVSERVCDRALNSVLSRAEIVGPWHRIDADTEFRLNGASLKLDEGLRVTLDAGLFRAVTSATSGLSFHAPALVSRLVVSRLDDDPAGAWRFCFAFGGRFSKDDGLGGIGNSLIGAWLGLNRGKLGGAMRTGIFQAQDKLNRVLSEELQPWVTVAQPLEMGTGGYAHFDWTRGLASGFTPTHSRGRGKAGEVMLNLDKLAAKLPGQTDPLRIRDIRFGDKRAIVSADPRASAATD